MEEKEIPTISKFEEIQMPQHVWDDIERFIGKLKSNISRPLALGCLLSGGIDEASKFRPETARSHKEAVDEINTYKFNNVRR